jgi:hypothetical protein
MSTTALISTYIVFLCAGSQPDSSPLHVICCNDTCSFTWTGAEHINQVRYSYLCTYDLYSPVHNVLDACTSITRASGRRLGPVKWHRANRRVPFGAQKTQCIGGFMHKKPTREVSGAILWGVEEQVHKGT